MDLTPARKRGAPERTGLDAPSDASARRETSTSRAALLDRDGTDSVFRAALHDLGQLANLMSLIRAHLAAEAGLTPSQYNLLMLASADEQGSTVGSLATALHVSSPFITGEVAKLSRMGLVAKAPDPSDRRVAWVRPTKTGLHLLAQLTPRVRETNDRFFAHLGRGDIGELLRIVRLALQGGAEVVAGLSAPPPTPGVVRISRPVRT